MKEWHVFCDRCSFRYRSDQLYRESLTGHMVCRKCLDPREILAPQFRERAQIPWTSPEISSNLPYTIFSPELSVGELNITGQELAGSILSEGLASGSLEITGTNISLNYFIALTDVDGESRGAISFDNGVTWSLTVPSDTSQGWIHVAHSGTTWCAVGAASGAGMLSSDGVNWTNTSLPAANDVYENIKWNGSYFLAIASAGVGAAPAKAAKSSDGVSWTDHTIAAFSPVRGLGWSDDLSLWVACGGLADPTLGVLTSPDGENWSGRSAANASWWAAQWLDDKFLVTSASGTADSFITSSDGTTWSTEDATAGGTDIAYNGTVAVVVHQMTAYRTTDQGATWTSHTIGDFGNYVSVAWNGQVFCAISYNDGTVVGSGISATSPDGETWTERQNMPSTDNWKVIRAPI